MAFEGTPENQPKVHLSADALLGHAAVTPDASGSTSLPFIFEEFSFSQILSEPAKPALVKGLLGKHEITCLYGAPKNGKSLVVLDLAAALIRGDTTFAERFTVKDPVNVVYAYGEGQSGMPNRFRGLNAKWQFTTAELARFKAYKKVPQLFRAESPYHIKIWTDEFLRRNGEDWLAGGLLVIDTYRRAMVGGSENDQKDTSITMEALQEAQERLGFPTILVLHHANRRGEISGSTNILSTVDSCFEVRREVQGEGVLSLEEAKDDISGAQVSFKIRNEPWLDANGEEHNAPYLEWAKFSAVQTTPRTKQQALVSQLVDILQNHCGSEDQALTVGEIMQYVEGGHAKPKVSDALKQLRENPHSLVKGVHKPDKTQNKAAWHYYFEDAEDEQL